MVRRAPLARGSGCLPPWRRGGCSALGAHAQRRASRPRHSPRLRRARCASPPRASLLRRRCRVAESTFWSDGQSRVPAGLRGRLFLGVFISTNEPRSPASAIVRMKITRIQLTSKPKCPSPHTSLPMSANKSRHTTLKMTEWWVMAHGGPARDVQNRCPWACGLPAAYCYFLEYDIRSYFWKNRFFE